MGDVPVVRTDVYDIRSVSYDVRTDVYDIRSVSHEVRDGVYDIRSASYEVRDGIYDIRSVSYKVRIDVYDAPFQPARGDSQPRESVLEPKWHKSRRWMNLAAARLPRGSCPPH